jgi:hypothetical protein
MVVFIFIPQTQLNKKRYANENVGMKLLLIFPGLVLFMDRNVLIVVIIKKSCYIVKKWELVVQV